MNVEAQAVSPQIEGDALERLRSRFQAEGYRFVEQPAAALLPDFFGNYRPDAVALKTGDNIAIEIKTHPDDRKRLRLQELQRLFQGRQGWRLTVVYQSTDPWKQARIPRPAHVDIVKRMNDVRALIALAQYRPAFVMSWSLLESALQTRDVETMARPLGSGAVIQALATGGYISPDVEKELRNRLDLRNRIVHGDVSAEASREDAEYVLRAVEEALESSAE